MKFGELGIDSDDLEGAILAHTLRLGGRAIKKGATLTARDVEQLRAAGYTEVTVARLESGDVHEDEAAREIASALNNESISMSDVGTGRCNLLAGVRGLVEIDHAQINAANAISEAVTIATLAPGTLVAEGDMVGTIKIIPFSVPDAVLREARGSLGLTTVRVTRLGTFDAGLVLTELPGISQSLLERASRAQRARLALLGSAVKREVRCAHTVEAVRRAIGTLADEGCNPILMLGASAIVDRGDVLPAALRAAGGLVTHVGMPMDPGNLLMLGSVGRATVFGLPGCARSLNPSGFDRVLQRFAAGGVVDSAMITGLGVGGLLKETRERPVPRSLGRPSRTVAKIAAIVLAAGSSKRMGDTNKLLLPVDGIPMVTRVVDAIAQSRSAETIVVTGHEPSAIMSALAGRDVRFAHNDRHGDGMGTSVARGFEALGDEYDGALVALGDMPWIEPEVVDRLISAFSPDGDLSIYIPMFGRKRGNPVLWGSRHFPELRQLDGDVGGKSLFRRYPEAICDVDVPTAAVNIDVDTPEAIERLRIEGRKRPEPT
ncbi:MAG: molybdopterin-binding/glycosyltransferase family 2 protein [Myxococcota bacterium]